MSVMPASKVLYVVVYRFIAYDLMSAMPGLRVLYVVVSHFIACDLMSVMPRSRLLYLVVCHFIVFARIGHDSNEVMDSTARIHGLPVWSISPRSDI